MPSLTKTIVFYLFAAMLALPLTLQAQSVENTINLYGTNFPQEKIHVHFDKEVYLPGETIWFKAYIFEEDIPTERSTNFYASLYDDTGKLIQTQLCPIFNATADGHFTIPDSIQSKQLICRAYTTWMLNFDNSFLFTKPIRLLNNNNSADSSKITPAVSLQFFPEGGDIIEGTRNTIAFKSNYNNGFPFELNGVIKNKETGEEIMPVTSLHDGMGRFDLEVSPGENFYAEWTDNKGSLVKTNLPKAKTSGVSLKLIIQKNNLIYNIVNKLSGDSLHVIMYMYQKVFFKTDISVPATQPFTGMVPVGKLPSGTMQLTVFNADWQPVAERVAFINNNNYTLNASISNKEISTQKRGRNIIEIEVADTIPANFSLSISDADLNGAPASSTIVTDLLLKGDIKGYIHDPTYYFSSNTDATVNANLDLVMLTHGWRRYIWDTLAAGKMPAINYFPENYLTVLGQVSKDILPRLDTAEIVNLIVKTIDSTQRFYFVRPDKNGLIKQAGLVFYDSAKVLFSFNKNKLLNPKMAFAKSNFTQIQPVYMGDCNSYLLPDTTGIIKFSQPASLFTYYNTNNTTKIKGDKTLLQGVIVKSGGRNNWKNDPLFLMDQKYTNGLFRSGPTSEAFDVLHDEMAAAKMDVLNYIGYHSSYIGLDNRGGDKKLKIGSGPPGIGPSTPPLIFIDENIVDASALQRLSITDVAYIKIVPHYLGTRNEDGEFVAAVSIYLKKGDDLIDRRPKETDLRFIKIPGYTPVKEFYSPDYSLSNTAMGTDARTTLLWQPYIFTDAGNRKIPVTFFNNDLSKKLRLVIEGINENGQMIHLEKIIE